MWYTNIVVDVDLQMRFAPWPGELWKEAHAVANSFITEAITIAKDGAQYNDAVKEILSDKIILAWILCCTTEEFRGMLAEEARVCIEGEPEVSKVPIEPGRTNEAITGDDTEDNIMHEGSVRFDIRFAAVTPHKKRIKIIVNVEAQKDFYPGYDLVTRGVYYDARLISSQKNREFTGSNYDDIKKVYSIWICLNVPKYAQNTVTEYKIHQDKLYGDYRGRARYDLMSVVMICLGEPEDNMGSEDTYQKLLRLLSVLASHRMEPEDKLQVLEEEYHIATTSRLEEGVNIMCNWSEGIIERITEEVTERVTEEVTERVTEEVTERITEEVTERITEEVREQVTEEVTGKVTKATKEADIKMIMHAFKISLEEACRILQVNSKEYA